MFFLDESSFCRPDRLIKSYWNVHIPFAFWFIKAHRPKTLVELNADKGDSYFNFCQAVKKNNFGTNCFAVDTWEAEDHAAFYDDRIFIEVSGHNAAYYKDFSQLLRMSSEEAAERFADKSVDFLHFHSITDYKTAKHIFLTWLPKLSVRGIVMLDGTNISTENSRMVMTETGPGSLNFSQSGRGSTWRSALEIHCFKRHPGKPQCEESIRERNVGVHKLWDELAAIYPNFEFFDGNGLGVLGIGKDLSERVDDLFKVEKGSSLARQIREQYSILGNNIIDKFTNISLKEELEKKCLELGSEMEKIKKLNHQLNSIQMCHGWRLLLFYYKFRDLLFPEKSKRRKLLKKFFGVIFNFFSIIISAAKASVKPFFLLCGKVRYIHNYRRYGELDLVILDDVFPQALSAFRFHEYNSYLLHFKKALALSLGNLFYPKGIKNEFKKIILDYERNYPQFMDRVLKYSFNSRFKAKLFYAIFLNDIHYFLNYIEKSNAPFIFTLYPGGGFCLGEAESDEKLRRVMSSALFRKVIVTQPITYDYLVDNSFCTPEKIVYVGGGVVPEVLLEKKSVERKFFGIDKPNLDICFVAAKYTEKGADKGYDMFIAAAKQLSANYDNINFHVVGGFSEKDIDVAELGGKIFYYGPRDSGWFGEFYRDKDLILSPNIPFKIFPGAFDGFPTGCCVDAGLCKVAIFCTDMLHLNTAYVDREDIVILPYNMHEIVRIIGYYYANPEKLRDIAERGYNKTRETYSFERQMKPRIELLRKELHCV